MPQMSQVLRERAIGMLTAGMSSRDARELNVHFSTITSLQRSIQPASQPQTTCNHTSPGSPSSIFTSTRTYPATIGLHNQRISVQTIRNRLREDHLHALCPHLGLDLTAVRHSDQLEWANAHIQRFLALWRGILFTDESRVVLLNMLCNNHAV